MFHHIPEPLLDRMQELERIDALDRRDGTPQVRRLRQVPPETGRLIALLAASAPLGPYVEIGTSGGYSALWLSLACRETGRSITTFDVDENKVRLARETFRMAGVTDLVEPILGDARERLRGLDGIAFCFLDAEKDIYLECYELVVPRLAPGGLLVADNVKSHAEVLQPFVDRAQADDRVDALVVPVGQGVLICRRS